MAPGAPITGVVLVFVESLNAGFVDAIAGPRAPPLTPTLDGWIDRPNSHLVRGYRTQARPTAAGLTAALCSVLPGSFPLNVRLDRPAATMTCLPEVLRAAGWQTELAQGSSKRYTGLERSFRQWGFERVWGRGDLEPRYPNAPRNPWGLHDRELFDFAEYRLEVLRDAGRPFLLTLVTLDSHLPGNARPDCQPPAPWRDDSMLRGVWCADAELAVLPRILERLGIADRTLVVVTADHAIQDTAAARAFLGPMFGGSFAELLLLWRLPAGRAAGLPDVALSGALDLAPTLAGVLGVRPGENSWTGVDLRQPIAAGRVVPARMGLRLVGAVTASGAQTWPLARLEARCIAEPAGVVDGTALTRCDLAAWFRWMDALWFRDAL